MRAHRLDQTSPRLAQTRIGPIALVLVLGLAACGGGSDASARPASPQALRAAVDRIDAIAMAVARWEGAESIEDAHAAAEEARNLVTGARTVGAGDLDGDGTAMGLAERGLLPGEGGAPGLVSPLEGCAEVERDVLGGSWSDPADRWQVAAAAIDAWAPANNTFPSLPSHPQRIVGWATLTLRGSTLEEAHEYAGHARLHIDITADAVAGCG